MFHGRTFSPTAEHDGHVVGEVDWPNEQEPPEPTYAQQAEEGAAEARREVLDEAQRRGAQPRGYDDLA